jgi:hypothetical protein
MTGFIRGLFGGNNQPRPPKPQKEGGAFFLDEDDAKTFGDIDYMRSSKVVKRTFARKKGQAEELESVRQISAMDKADVREDGVPMKKADMATSSFQSPTVKPVEEKFKRRTADSSMDMFRNMAKDLKK